jgi:hypothetical protein
MEVEISSRLLNCSGDWMAAMVANDFHLILRTLKVSGCRGHALFALSRGMPELALTFSGIFEERESGIRSS